MKISDPKVLEQYEDFGLKIINESGISGTKAWHLADILFPEFLKLQTQVAIMREALEHSIGESELALKCWEDPDNWTNQTHFVGGNLDAFFKQIIMESREALSQLNQPSEVKE